MKHITPGSLDIDMSFSHGLPFSWPWSTFFMGRIHVIEVGQAVLPWISLVVSLDFLMQLHHSAEQQASLYDPWGNQIQFWFLEASRLAFFCVSYIKYTWCFSIIPIFLREGTNRSLLGFLLPPFVGRFFFKLGDIWKIWQSVVWCGETCAMS